MHSFIIDDDHVSLFLTEQALRREGVPEVPAFLSAEKALDCLRQRAPENLPEFVLLDLNMPGMNGWSFLDALKPYERLFWSKTKVYILTSSLDQRDSARSHEYPLVSGFIHIPPLGLFPRLVLFSFVYTLNQVT